MSKRTDAAVTAAADLATRLLVGGRTELRHTEAHTARRDAATRVIEGVGKDDVAADAQALWLAVGKAVANDAKVRKQVIDTMADALEFDVYYVASFFVGLVEKGQHVHPNAFTVKFNAKNEPKHTFLVGRRVDPANAVSRAVYLEGISSLAKRATEKSMLAAFQSAVATLVREGKVKIRV